MNPEKIAYWFFRLNGCFTFENFIVHPDQRGSQETDADIIALRFRHRRELSTSDNPMQDHELFATQDKYLSVFLVEAKSKECELNGPWRKPKRRNLQRVLNAMGFFDEPIIEDAAKALYDSYHFDHDLLSIRFAMVGKSRSQRRNWGHIPQLTWDEILRWMHSRYITYRDQKADNKQWDDAGRELYGTAVGVYEYDADAYIQYWLETTKIEKANNVDE